MPSGTLLLAHTGNAHEGPSGDDADRVTDADKTASLSPRAAKLLEDVGHNDEIPSTATPFQQTLWFSEPEEDMGVDDDARDCIQHRQLVPPGHEHQRCELQPIPGGGFLLPRPFVPRARTGNLGALELSQDSYATPEVREALDKLQERGFAVRYVYVPAERKVLVGLSKHETIRKDSRVPEDLVFCGGEMRFWKSAGVWRTNEHSGHYGPNWTSHHRLSFLELAHLMGFPVLHSEYHLYMGYLYADDQETRKHLTLWQRNFIRSVVQPGASFLNPQLLNTVANPVGVLDLLFKGPDGTTYPAAEVEAALRAYFRSHKLYDRYT